MLTRLLSCWILFAALGCIGPQLSDGSIACDENGGCPDGFECAVDQRCYREPGECGNEELDPGETCDPAALCPVVCDDGNACTRDNQLGSELTCNLRCVRTEVADCSSGDGCCPAGCDASDSDCLDTCGNEILDPGETCEDGVEPCDFECSDGDACTQDVAVGSPSNCNVACVFLDIDTCVDGDGCCPAVCNAGSDSDCSSECGDGEIDPGELCDGESAPCPQREECAPSRGCSVVLYQGSEANCNARCVVNPITSCTVVADGCCPDIECASDPDCIAPPITCLDGLFDPDVESCDDSDLESTDGICPTECDAGGACERVVLVGSPGSCDAECLVVAISECIADDGCCPAGCQGENADQAYYDSDCVQ